MMLAASTLFFQGGLEFQFLLYIPDASQEKKKPHIASHPFTLLILELKCFVS